MLVGYARVSTSDQKMDLQFDALKKDGCGQIYSDVSSGARTDRPELDRCISFLRKGDILVVWKLDRLGRSLRHLLNLVAEMELKEIGFRSIQENIDTTTAGGKLIFHLFASLAEFERELIRERTVAGLSAARARGINEGRPRVLSVEQVKMAQKMLADKTIPIKEILDTFKISKSTLYKSVREYGKEDAYIYKNTFQSEHKII
ncbi:MAG TPA: recombinase family protein [bacterium]|nr:recombinase family protein [bacterium]HQN74349.1 recombinase family protein [bacterium]HQO91187.1 recombinase family protein [bacterium]